VAALGGSGGVVYVVWGSTYLAIRIGVETIPPLLLAGVRYLVAGAVLFPVAVRLGGPAVRVSDRPGRRQWAGTAVVGTLLLAMGNGGVSYAEQTVPSGLAALLLATVPLWMVAVDRLVNGTPVSRRAAAALGMGLVGVGILSRPGSHGADAVGVAVVLGAAASWGLGSVLAGRLGLPSRPLLGTAMEMLAGGVVLLVAAVVDGEPADLSVGEVSGRSVGALLYLIGPGSLLALSAYVLALQRLPTSTVATYAYVNPVVAVLLGAVVLDEVVNGRIVVGAAVVVVAVALSLSARRRGEPGASPDGSVSGAG
jgi:drug/metabolite transporter (DMT)-like permease